MEKDLEFIFQSLKDSNLHLGLETLQRLLTKHKSNKTNLQIILERLYSFSQDLIKLKLFRPIFPLFQILSKLCFILEDYSRLCNIKNSLSFCYRTSGQVNQALKECLEALEIASEHKSLVSKLPALHLNACAIYREDVKDLNIAKTHAELAYFFAKEHLNLNNEKDKRTFAVSCFNYGVVLEEMKDRVHAEVWFKEGLKFCEENWDDLAMEQAFREKINLLAKGKVRTISQKPSSLKKYHFIKDIKLNKRPRTNNLKRKPNKYSLTPISHKNNPITSLNLEKSLFYQEIDPESKLRSRDITPSGYIKAKLLTESYKSSAKGKLSLMQCLIKIQRWYRKVFRKKFKPEIQYFYYEVKSFQGVQYFFSICKDGLVEAWPLSKGTKKPKNVQINIGDICRELDMGEDELKESRALKGLFNINNSKIEVFSLKKIFKGNYLISEKEFLVYIWCIDRVLEIEASSGSEKYNCSVKLDPLQDAKNLKSKLNIILANLIMRSGELVFNLT